MEFNFCAGLMDLEFGDISWGNNMNDFYSARRITMPPVRTIELYTFLGGCANV
jgi:hypothetical protein